MADSLQLTITKTDGTVVSISGPLSGVTITETAPAPPPATITGVQAAATPSTVSAGATAQCSATVEGTGSFSSAVTWSTIAGAISADGVFTAPAAGGPVTITATSVEDTSKKASVTIVVQAVVIPPPSGAPVIPATAKVVDMLQPPNAWQMNHDAGTPGTVPACTTTYPVTAPDGTKNCRQFAFTTTAKAGAIYHSRALDSAHLYNRFAYKKREMKTDPGGWGTIGQCETDLEITGQTSGIPYDMAMQQNTNDGQEDITINHKWTGSGVKANPTTRANGVWHESVEYVGFDPVANTVTYFGVEIDGVYYPINKTVTDADNAVWGKDIVNLQLQWDSNQAASTDHVILCDLLQIAAWKE